MIYFKQLIIYLIILVFGCWYRADHFAKPLAYTGAILSGIVGSTSGRRGSRPARRLIPFSCFERKPKLETYTMFQQLKSLMSCRCKNQKFVNARCVTLPPQVQLSRLKEDHQAVEDGFGIGES